MAEEVRVSLSPRHRKAVELLAAGYSVRETAAALGISDRTLRRWVRRRDVAQALRELQQEAWGAAARRLRALGTRAVDTLAEVMRDVGAAPSARVGAARVTLELIVKVGEMEELRERLERLEALAERFKEGITE